MTFSLQCLHLFEDILSIICYNSMQKVLDWLFCKFVAVVHSPIQGPTTYRLGSFCKRALTICFSCGFQPFQLWSRNINDVMWLHIIQHNEWLWALQLAYIYEAIHVVDSILLQSSGNHCVIHIISWPSVWSLANISPWRAVEKSHILVGSVSLSFGWRKL